MPKEIVNNRINGSDIYGMISRMDTRINQGLNTNDSPTFANLVVSGDARVNGNLYVDGNTTVLGVDNIELTDNIIVINSVETGFGVTLNQAGIEVERGVLENVRLVWDESNKRFEAGLASELYPVALRESVPLSGGIMVWNPTSKLLESVSEIDGALGFSSQEESYSSSTGSVVMKGGLGVAKDMFIDGKINLVGDNDVINVSSLYNVGTVLNIASVGDINIMPGQDIRIPYDKGVILGGDNQYVSASSINGDVDIGSGGDMNLNVLGDYINIPNQVALTFSSSNEKVYTDVMNNLKIASSADISLSPGNGVGANKVLIPVNTPLAFNTVSQSISANISDDLILNAGNNIFLNPGVSKNIKVPVDIGVMFGSTDQKILGNVGGDVLISSGADIYLMPASNINIAEDVLLTFYDDNQSLMGDIDGNLVFKAGNESMFDSVLHVRNVTNSTYATNGSVICDGGLGVSKDIVCEGKISVVSGVGSLVVNNEIEDIFSVDSDVGKVSIYTGDGGDLTPSLEINSSNNVNARSLIQLKAGYDGSSGYMIGRGTSSLNSGRVLSVNVPNYSVYSSVGVRPRFSVTSNNTNIELFSVEEGTGDGVLLGGLNVSSEEESLSSLSGALVLGGGLGVAKNIYTGGKVNISVDSGDAFQINDVLLNEQLRVDTISRQFTLNQSVKTNIVGTDAFVVSDTVKDVLKINTVDNIMTSLCQNFIKDTRDSSDTSTGALVVSGGVGIQKSLNVDGVVVFGSGLDMSNNNILNLSNPSLAQDAATKAYVDMISSGVIVRDSVACATIQAQVLASDFTPGSVIDGYTLVLNDRILLKHQTNAVENGLYRVTGSVPVRTVDFQSGINAVSNFVFVREGTVNADLGFICNTYTDDVVDTDPLNFTEYTGIGNTVAGDGLTRFLNILSVNVDNSSIEINGNVLRLSSNGVGNGLSGGGGVSLQTASDQSHVTKLGVIDTGVWNGSTVGVLYGGTGRSYFSSGSVLFGNNGGALNSSAKLYYDEVNTRVGLGTNVPSKDIEVKSDNTVTLLLNADANTSNVNGKPEIKMSYGGGVFNSYIGMTRNFNEYAGNVYSGALVVSNDQNDSSSKIQLATNQQSRLTILSDGNVGINTSNPSATLQVSGSLKVSSDVLFSNTRVSVSSSEGAVVMSGGLSINNTSNSVNLTNGGALTVNGGLSVKKDTYIGGTLYADLLSISMNNISSTTEALNYSTGSFLTAGGVTVKCTTDALSVTNGGSLLVAGGGSIRKSLFVGGTMYAEDAYLNNMFFKSSATENFIQGPNDARDESSFLPIHFTEYNNTVANTFTIRDSGVILNNNKTLQMGGTLSVPDGYTMFYTTGNLNVIPSVSFYDINIGAVGSVSNLNVYGNSGGQLSWESTNSNLSLMLSSIELISSSVGSMIINTPDTSSNMYIKAINSDFNLRIGGNSVGGELSTVLSNSIEDASITFAPSVVTNSSLVLTGNVDSTFNGSVRMLNSVVYSGNALHDTVNNTAGSSLWVYMGEVTDYCEVEINGVGVGLRVIVSVISNVCTVEHSFVGSSLDRPDSYIYNDGLDNFYLFVLLPANSVSNINVIIQNGLPFVLSNEGIGGEPDGSVSGFSGWFMVYSTGTLSTLKYSVGDLIAEGSVFRSRDNLPVLGYHDVSVVTNRDLGVIYQRSQYSNNNNEGDVVNGEVFYGGVFGDQSGIVSLDQCRLGVSASVINEYYTGMWIKVVSGVNVGQVRRVLSYNGAQKILTLDSEFVGVLPDENDMVSIYNKNYVTNYYDTLNGTFALSYTKSVMDDNIESVGDASLRIKSLYSTDTSVSVNSSTGSVYLLGGISIDNSENAESATSGGTITTSGGVGIRRNLLVGENIGVGTDGFNPVSSLHIKKSVASVTFESETGSYSYIDFVESGTLGRFGVLSDSDFLSFTNTQSGDTPESADKVLVINNSGYIGINTTSDITSPLTLNRSNFISTNSSTGYLGLIGGNSNVNDSLSGGRVLLFANSQDGDISAGSLNLYAGGEGEVCIFTDNDEKRFTVSSSGSVSMSGSVSIMSTVTSSSTIGALMVSGGVSIFSSQNASSNTVGGSFTTLGGASIGKDLYIGGNIYINGELNATGSVSSPSLDSGSFEYINCGTFVYDYVNYQLNGNLAVLTFMCSVIPSVSNENCVFAFKLPEKTNSFSDAFEVVSTCSGYAGDFIPLFNVLSYGKVGTGKLNIKFQSISTGVHTFQVMATYIKS